MLTYFTLKFFRVDDLHTGLDISETTASKLGLHVTWQNTKIQNLGVGDSEHI